MIVIFIGGWGRTQEQEAGCFTEIQILDCIWCNKKDFITKTCDLRWFLDEYEKYCNSRKKRSKRTILVLFQEFDFANTRCAKKNALLVGKGVLRHKKNI